VTIEDPIEYAFRDKRSVINQRELGFDTTAFSRALRAALRQDPDVILVGEMRDLETVEIAMTAAETGHLVLSTLHTVDAAETINRVISIFPPHQQAQVRLQLAGILKGVISQRLVPRADGKGMVPAVEIMVQTARVRELIEDPVRTKELHDAIKEGKHPYGMVSFDQSLTELVQRRLVTYEEAVRQSTNPDDFALYFRGVSQSTDVQAWSDPNAAYQRDTQPNQPARSPSQVGQRAASQPPAAAGGGTQSPQAGTDDPNADFQIERFGK